jgi:hypothetical protein
VGDGDRAACEDEVICVVLEKFATVDGINLPNTIGGELLARRVQLIREAYRISPSAPDYSGADYFMGWGRRHAGGAVQRSLTAYVSEQLRSDAAIAKESRKAREERALRASRKPGPKGDGKGGGGKKGGTPGKGEGAAQQK